MKKLILLFSIIIFISAVSFSQVVNLNPDSNGEPWLAGGWKTPTAEDMQKINKIPEMKILAENRAKDLPISLDNTTQPYFRPIFIQTHGSCAQASGVGYVYTYEINRIRETNASVADNQFPTHFTYNFLNSGDGANGSWFWDGWEIIKANGCPTVTEYGSLAQDANYWMSSYDSYQSGMQNTLVDIFSIEVGTPEGLETFKYWLYEHGTGSDVGGIASFAAGVSDEFSIDNNIIYHWGHSVNHAMTFVGWDDNIQYDFNNDGQYTNDIDINNDGIVDMKDWEIGALIMVNSWGSGWENGGKAYVMYKLLAEPVSNGGLFENSIYSVNIRGAYEPQMVMKVKMEHNIRNQIKIQAGVSTNLSATEPDYELSFPLFNYQGGEFNMRGDNTAPIEFTLDITSLLSYIETGEEAKFFLMVSENDNSGSGSGQIYDFSVIDVANSNEYICSSHNISIINNDVTILSTDATVVFDAPEVLTQTLPDAGAGQFYSFQLEAQGGEAPYTWDILLDYSEEDLNGDFPSIDANQLSPSSDDDGYAAQELDFDFPFYGSSYDEVFILTDGSICFESGFDYIRNEEAIRNNEVISVFAADLMIYPEQNDGLFYEGDDTYATFRWKTSQYDQADVNVDVAVTLFPSGEIQFFYGDPITNGLNWAAGVSKGDGSNYEIASISNDNNPANNELKFTCSDFPLGMSILEDGIFQGTPANEGVWDIEFLVTDYNKISKSTTLNFEVLETAVSSIANDILEINCYPNPFVDNITISFSNYEKQNIKISIYDISGKIITTLTNKQYEVGNHNITFKADKINSGVYFVKFYTENQIIVKKLISN